MFLGSPLGYGWISNTASTLAPSNVMRLAMIMPMSPEPKIITWRPTILFFRLMYVWATPAVNTPDGRSPGIERAPRVRSLHPMARITAFAW